jgi:methionine-rich copper-binding protein CopC
MSLMIAAAWLVTASVAHAHSHLEKATPADNAVLNEAPQQLSLEFSKVARVTAITLQREGAAATKVSSLPTAFATKQAIPLQDLVPGKYLVNWRVVGEDNHVMSGKLHFTIESRTP